MKSNKRVRQQEELEKPTFGSIYRTKGSRYLYVSFYYFNERLRFPTDREDTPKNREELIQFMNNVGEKIRLRTFQFAKTFYWLDDKTKGHFTALEGRDFKPEPEHLLFGEYAREWMERKIPGFATVTKQEYYSKALNSRILPFFEKKSFASITTTTVESFIDSLDRVNNPDVALSIKRIKNIVCPLAKVWQAACDENNWTLRNPFTCLPAKYKDIQDKALQEKELNAFMNDDGDENALSKRDVFLLMEWELLRKAIDPHYHLAMELLLRGLIGSELEGVQKADIKEDSIVVRRTVVHEKGGKLHLKFKPKNWYRKREIPITNKLKPLVVQAVEKSASTSTIRFEGGLELPANSFLLTMKDGKPFNYESFRDTVWNKAIKETGLPHRVPYASRHTFVQWGLLIGVAKTRMVDLMGHSNKKMIDEVYGTYRNGLVDEREAILVYLGEDFLALEELKLAFPERYQRKMALPTIPTQIANAPGLTATFGQSFGQSQGLYADNYQK
jgi:integrase